MVGLAFGIAASANFPFYFYQFIGKLTTRGAFIGGFMGLITAVSLVVLGPNVWVQILGNEKLFSLMLTLHIFCNCCLLFQFGFL